MGVVGVPAVAVATALAATATATAIAASVASLVSVVLAVPTVGGRATVPLPCLQGEGALVIIVAVAPATVTTIVPAGVRARARVAGVIGVVIVVTARPAPASPGWCGRSRPVCAGVVGPAAGLWGPAEQIIDAAGGLALACLAVSSTVSAALRCSRASVVSVPAPW